MSHRGFFLLGVLIGGLVMWTSQAGAAAPPPSSSSKILLKLRDAEQIPAALQTLPMHQHGILELTLNQPETLESTLAYLRTFPEIVWAEPVSLFRLQTTTPNDPSSSLQWGLAKLDLPEAWDLSHGSPAVTIGIIDTGIDGNHDDLTGRVVAGHNFVSNSTISANSNSDDNSHGTNIAGVIGALTNNGVGIAGVDWNARLMPLKVADAVGNADATAVTNAIIFAADNGVDVLNMSLGSSADNAAVRDAIDYAGTKNVVMVGAAGNESGQPILYPAAYSGVIAVGSVDTSDVRSSFSNIGPELDVMAPGEAIVTTTYRSSAPTNHSQYETVSGTSLSAPYVSGVAALLLDYHPGLTPSDVETILRATADKPAGMSGQTATNSYGYGRVNATRALHGFNDYHASYISQSAFPTIRAGESATLTVQLQNSGRSSWPASLVKLGTDRNADRIPIFIPGAGWVGSNRIAMQQGEVNPGESATFTFAVTAPSTVRPGVYREYFRPVADGFGWLEDFGLYWDVTVTSGYLAGVSNQTSFPTLIQGESAQFEVKLLNTGTTTWTPDIVRLGTDRAENRTPVFTRGTGWLSENRIQLQESSVSPGGTGTFRFVYTVPATIPAGVYRDYFRPVADGIGWLADLGLYWDITVADAAAAYPFQIVSQNSYPTLSSGQSYQFRLTVQNTGSRTWTRESIRLGTDRSADRTPVFTLGSGWIGTNRIAMEETSVAPGQTATFIFSYQVPAGLAGGTYTESFRLVADGLGWLSDAGLFWRITVL